MTLSLKVKSIIFQLTIDISAIGSRMETFQKTNWSLTNKIINWLSWKIFFSVLRKSYKVINFFFSRYFFWLLENRSLKFFFLKDLEIRGLKLQNAFLNIEMSLRYSLSITKLFIQIFCFFNFFLVVDRYVRFPLLFSCRKFRY